MAKTARSWDRPLDAHEVCELIRLTSLKLPQREICQRLRRNHHVISSTQRRLQINVRIRRRTRLPDPTVDEIYRHAASIRKSWTANRLRKSHVGADNAWRPIVVPESVLRLARS